ncbi:unnamed protein product [Rhodiola kirilowii]
MALIGWSQVELQITTLHANSSILTIISSVGIIQRELIYKC